jgi:hypothetical protein
MRDPSIRSLMSLAVLLALPVAVAAQAPQQAETLVIAGQSDHAPLLRINGKSYVDIESLARIVHGSIRFEGNQTILTLPGATGAPEQAALQPIKPPQISEAYLRAEIEDLTAIHEWRAAIVIAVQSNKPVTEGLVGGLRRSAESKLHLAIAAATTDPDRSATGLLRNEFANMQQMSDQFLAMHTDSSYIPPDSFESNPLDQKIQACARGLTSMAATKQFQDEPSCH